MNLKLLSLTLILISISLACRNSYYRSQTVYHISTVNNNVNKKLFGKVVLYAVFVDSRKPRPWTTYDIFSTIDSINKATKWIMDQSKLANIDLNIQLEYHRNKDIIPIDHGLYGGSLSETLFEPNIIEGSQMLDMWANGAAKKAGLSLGEDTSRFVETKNRITDRERLIARLRDKYKTDNVVLMFFINNYHQEEISLAMHTSGQEETEYAVVSFKHPAVIAHEFLHIFGALDLYMSPFDKKRRTLKNKNKIMEAYPNEVMAFAYRSIESMQISPLTQYLLGWKPVLDEKDAELLTGKRFKVPRY